MQFPDDDNGAILRCLAEHRFDFESEHPVDFFALLPNDAAAQAVAEHYRKLQKEDSPVTDVELRPGLDGKSIELVVTQLMTVNYENVCQFEKQFELVCRKHKGTTDGWGVLHDEEEG